MTLINDFRNSFLSNMWTCPVYFGGVWFASVEHGYVAAKCEQWSDVERVRAIANPYFVKKIGRQIRMRPAMLEDAERLRVMWELLNSKFRLGTAEREWLAGTGRAELVEGNTWGDRFWGVCGGVGENHLGRMLMAIRADIR